MRHAYRTCALAILALALLLVPAIGHAPRADALDASYEPLPRVDLGPRQTWFGLEMDPATGYLHATNTVTDKIDVFNTQGVLQESYGSTTSGSATLDYPADVAFMDDSIYVTYWSSKRVVRYDRTTKAQTGSVVVTGPVGLDAADGEVYVADRTAGIVRVFNADLVQLRQHTAANEPCGHSPNDVAVHDGTMYVVGHKLGEPCRTQGIWQTDRALGTVADVAYPSPPMHSVDTATSYAVDISDDGRLFATDSHGLVVFQPDAHGGMTPQQIDLNAGAVGITADASGDSAWILRRGASGGAIFGVTAALCEGQVPTVVGTSANDLIDLSYLPDGQVVWFGDGDEDGSTEVPGATHTLCGGVNLYVLVGPGIGRPVPCTTIGEATVVTTSTVEQSECDALEALYDSTGGPGWTTNTGWSAIDDGGVTDPCTWYGVGCNTAGISGLFLKGPAEASWEMNMVGTLPPEIGDLANLELLHIRGGHGLTGELPGEIGALTNLRILVVWHVGLEGEIPSELGTLTALEHLSLGNVPGLTGTMSSYIANLTSLRTMSVWATGVQDSLTAMLDQLPAQMEHIALGSGFTGQIPASINRFTALEGLSVRGDHSGAIPDAFATMAALERLAIMNTGATGSIPPSILELPNLTNLFLGNNALSGGIPDRIRNLDGLQQLDLSGNDFKGSIPGSLRTMTELSYLRLDDNHLSGWVADEISELQNLAALDISGNRCLEASASTITFLGGFGQDGHVSESCAPEGPVVTAPLAPSGPDSPAEQDPFERYLESVLLEEIGN